MPYKVKILLTQPITPDVKRFVVEKPQNYQYIPGQAAYVSINSPGWELQKRPFCFTSLTDDPCLEFMIKAYKDHSGVTARLHLSSPSDELLISEPFGTIQYRGPGVFLAAGAGITPFIAIFRSLHQKNLLIGNSLIFSNKTKVDIILESELKVMFPNKINLQLTLTQEENPYYIHGRIDKHFLTTKISNFQQYFYLCGSNLFVEDLKKYLLELGTSENFLIFEKLVS